jgi:hypothetical protein
MRFMNAWTITMFTPHLHKKQLFLFKSRVLTFWQYILKFNSCNYSLWQTSGIQKGKKPRQVKNFYRKLRYFGIVIFWPFCPLLPVFYFGQFNFRHLSSSGERKNTDTLFYTCTLICWYTSTHINQHLSYTKWWPVHIGKHDRRHQNVSYYYFQIEFEVKINMQKYTMHKCYLFYAFQWIIEFSRWNKSGISLFSNGGISFLFSLFFSRWYPNAHNIPNENV